MKKRLPIVLLFLLLFIAACFFYFSLVDKQTTVPQQKQSKSSDVDYTNKSSVVITENGSHRYSFSCPSDMIVEKRRPTGNAEEVLALQIKAPKTVTTIAKVEIRSSPPPNKFVRTQTVGYDADGNEVITYIYPLRDGKSLQLKGTITFNNVSTDYSQMLEKIASSIKIK